MRDARLADPFILRALSSVQGDVVGHDHLSQDDFDLHDCEEAPRLCTQNEPGISCVPAERRRLTLRTH